MEPLRVPAAVGVKVTESVQLPAADTLVAQVSVSAKSPLEVIDVIASAELPMLRSRTDCPALVVPTTCTAYCSALGLTLTAGAAVGPILSTKASVPPPSTFWKAPCVTGKSGESVDPPT